MQYSANRGHISSFLVGRAAPRRAIGTGQLSCLQFRSGPIARRGAAV
ncbi:hypothetical protein [Desulfocicer vacuolatum]|nr:hypothetical protein [Desulfocicer vacuolatum]